jgi:hypothetical protein
MVRVASYVACCVVSYALHRMWRVASYVACCIIVWYVLHRCCVSQAANVTFIDENCAHFYHYAQRLIDAEYTAELTATSRCRALRPLHQPRASSTSVCTLHCERLGS